MLGNVPLPETLRLPRAAATKCQRLGGLNKKCLSFSVLEAGKCKTEVPADEGPGEGPVPGLQVAMLLLCPHGAERELVFLFF